MRTFAITLTLGLGLIGLLGPGPAPVLAQTTPHVARSVAPEAGRYGGRDEHDRLITFTYTRAHGIQHFRIDHHLVGGARVSDGAWDRTCRHGYCMWGRWRTDDHVTGRWLRLKAAGGRRASGSVSFQASHPVPG